MAHWRYQSCPTLSLSRQDGWASISHPDLDPEGSSSAPGFLEGPRRPFSVDASWADRVRVRGGQTQGSSVCTEWKQAGGPACSLALALWLPRPLCGEQGEQLNKGGVAPAPRGNSPWGVQSWSYHSRFSVLLQTQPGIVWNPGLGQKLAISPNPSIHSLLCPALQGLCGQWSPSWEGYGAPYSTEDALWPFASP